MPHLRHLRTVFGFTPTGLIALTSKYGLLHIYLGEDAIDFELLFDFMH